MPESSRRRSSGRKTAARHRQAPEAPAAEAAPRRKLVLLAGAGGALGRAVAAELKRRGYRVRALTRDPSQLTVDVDEVFSGNLVSPSTLKGACRGADAVISCAGAKVGFMGLGKGRNSYRRVDELGNVNLLEEALISGVSKFVYVSVFGGRFLGALEYIRAHESFATILRASGMDYAIIRPTGFFSAYKRVFDSARKGRVTLIGDGSARTNPIAEEDLAALCVELLSGHRQEVDAGGPEVLSRREIGELAFQALGKEPKFRHIPLSLALTFSRLMRLTGRHNSDIAEFFALAAATDLGAPQVGTRPLDGYFHAVAQGEA